MLIMSQLIESKGLFTVSACMDTKSQMNAFVLLSDLHTQLSRG